MVFQTVPLTGDFVGGDKGSRQHPGKCSVTTPYCAAAHIVTLIDDRESRDPKLEGAGGERQDLENSLIITCQLENGAGSLQKHYFCHCLHMDIYGAAMTNCF